MLPAGTRDLCKWASSCFTVTQINSDFWVHALANIELLLLRKHNLSQGTGLDSDPINCQGFRAEPPKNSADFINLPPSFGWGHIANVSNSTMGSSNSPLTGNERIGPSGGGDKWVEGDEKDNEQKEHSSKTSRTVVALHCGSKTNGRSRWEVELSLCRILV